MSKYSIVKEKTYFSLNLSRNVTVRFVSNSTKPSKIVFMNDGQDLESLNFVEGLNVIKLRSRYLFVCIHANERRLNEYGTANQADYKNRGNLAGSYASFVIKELLPQVLEEYELSNKSENQYFMGFSLGGLSAMDIVWNNPDSFSKVGIFSGSFWWRKKAYEDGYDDENDRIMHVQVRNTNQIPKLKFWFECGTKDEDSDRNNNGIIDSIDDTQDLIMELSKKGFLFDQDIKYVEVKDGEHNQKTWSEIMPNFLNWLDE